MTEQELRLEIKQVVKHQTLKGAARELKVSVSYLHDVVKGRRKPGGKLLKALGLERKVEYVKAAA